MATYDHQNLESVYQASASEKSTNLQLIFSTRVVASPVFTGKKICENKSMRVMLVDSQTQEKVTSGEAASAKVELVLLPGDFGGGWSWTPLDFKNSIVVNWERKTKLLLGDVSFNLEHGSGTIGEIRIKHDRNPLSKVKFRLGAMVVGCPYPYQIKEAISDAFEVKDRRNESKFSGPLSLTDWVWQLMNISKKGPIRKRLENANIFKVRDFLDKHFSNPQQLQKICGLKGKKWDKTVNHAKACLFQKVCNTCGSVGSTSQLSNKLVLSIDYNGHIELDNNCYKPQPCENDLWCNRMIVDHNFSTHEVELCDMVVHGGFEPCQEDGIDGVVGNGGQGQGVVAKRRWMKVRATLWFSMLSFMKKFGLCVHGCHCHPGRLSWFDGSCFPNKKFV